MATADDHILSSLRRSLFAVFTVGVILGFLVWQFGDESSADDDVTSEEDSWWESVEERQDDSDHEPAASVAVVTDSLHSHQAPTLQQYKGYKCTIAANDLIVRRLHEEDFSVDRQYRYEAVDERTCNQLAQLARMFDLYLIVQVGDGAGERGPDDAGLQRECEDVLELLTQLGVLTESFRRHRIIFCETQEGVRHIARALGSTVHFDGAVVLLS